MSCSVAISVFSLGGWTKGGGACVRNTGHEHDFCQAQKAENTDPCTNYAVKYATARGHLNLGRGCDEAEISEEKRLFTE